MSDPFAEGYREGYKAGYAAGFPDGTRSGYVNAKERAFNATDIVISESNLARETGAKIRDMIETQLGRRHQ
jgi:flagellar biosynthesis/type III secretory pathway protein FliH